jgi:membrane-associated protease RseP (regulator of RpoE activity)
MAAGLLPGDEVVAIGTTRVRTADEVSKVFRALGDSTPVDITIARAGVVERLAASVRLDPDAEIALPIVEPENPLRRKWLRRME